MVLFASFWVLTLRSVSLFGIALFGPDFHLPLLGPREALGLAYGFAKDILVTGALAAAGAFFFRRIFIRPDRLTRSPEGLFILLLIAALMATELAFEGATRCARGTPGTFWAPASSLAASALGAVGLHPPALCLWVEGSLLLHLSLLLAFLNFLPHGKHFHVLIALPNVFLARLSPRSALSPLDLEAEDASYGAATVKDLSWKEGLDVLACTECGRCQTHCPTYLSGKPLSHKEVNRALRRHLKEQGPRLLALARSGLGAGKAAEDVATLVSVIPPETAWACTTCGWCETACPVLIDNIPRLVSMRRQQVLVEADFPEEARRVFRGNPESQGNPLGVRPIGAPIGVRT